MWGKAAVFDREMHQVNIASMDVLMQLVQVVERMRESQSSIIDALEITSADASRRSHGALVMARIATEEADGLATELSTKLSVLVQQVERVTARYRAWGSEA